MLECCPNLTESFGEVIHFRVGKQRKIFPNLWEMDAGIEKECSALGGLFQLIMNDMKVYHSVYFLSPSAFLLHVHVTDYIFVI